MPGSPNVDFGETVTTTVDHSNLNPYDCLSWAAIIFSTAVKDDDDDGLPDGIEDSATALSDPGTSKSTSPLPKPRNAMGANSSHKDIVVEMDAMRTTVDTNGSADGLTSYGSAAFPYPFSPTPTVTAGAHNHLPTPAALKILIDAYRKAPFTNPRRFVPDGDLAAFRCRRPNKLHHRTEQRPAQYQSSR